MSNAEPANEKIATSAAEMPIPAQPAEVGEASTSAVPKEPDSNSAMTLEGPEASAPERNAPPAADPAHGAVFHQTVHMGFHAANFKENDIAAIQNIIKLEKSISDLIEVEIKPYIEPASCSALCDRLRSVVFTAPLPSAGLVVLQYPDGEILDALGAAALACLRQDIPQNTGGAAWIDVAFLREERSEWISATVTRILAGMESSKVQVGFVRPSPGSEFRGGF